jgi:2,4-didehydro-3-deoxy-L-rhamnonate hydrolase
MKQAHIIRFEAQEKVRWGLIDQETITELTIPCGSTRQLIANLPQALSSNKEALQFNVKHTRVLSPITPDQQFICQGLNYRQHLLESGIDPAKLSFNTLFTKAGSSLTGAYEEVVKPMHVRLLDYEAEIGFVISRTITSAQQISQDNWHEYVAGLVLSNDITARDIQLPQGQFYKGKSYRGFAPTGPWITLSDTSNLRNFDNIHVMLKVNGQIRQDFQTSDMLFKPWQTLTELTGLQDLYPGDLVITGTSGGVAVRAPGKLVMFVARHFLSESTRWKTFIKKGMANPMYLKAGDVIELSAATPDGTLDLGNQKTRITTAQSKA